MSLRKVLALTLVLCMVLSFFPVSAFADDFVIEDQPEETEEYITTIEEQPEEPEQKEEALVEETEQPEQEEELAEVIVDETEEPEESAENPDEQQAPAAPEAENDKAEAGQPAIAGLEAREEAQLEAGTGTITVTKSGEAAQSYNDLHEALEAAVAAAAGGWDTTSVTVDISSDITFADTDTWTPVEFKVLNPITINGNNCTITNLPGMLFYKQGSGVNTLTVNDLTFSYPKVNSGTYASVIMGYYDSGRGLYFNNVHIDHATVVSTGSYAGAFCAYSAGYNNLGDGPVYQKIVVDRCSVTNSTITGANSSGALFGHAMANSDSKIVVTNTYVQNNTITVTDDSQVKAGAIVGTINVGGGEDTNFPGDAGMYISANVSGNTLTSGGANSSAIFGRIVGGKLYMLPGGRYADYPIKEDYATSVFFRANADDLYPAKYQSTNKMSAEEIAALNNCGYGIVAISGGFTVAQESVEPEPIVTVDETTGNVTATIPTGVFKSGESAQEVTIAPESGSNVSVTFDADAAATIAANADGSTVTLKVEDKTGAGAGNTKTFEITMVKMIEGQEVGVFSGDDVQGTATVTVPFTRSNGEGAAEPRVNLVTEKDGNTVKTPVEITEITDTTVTFVAEHFSEYEVSQGQAVVSVTSGAETKYYDDLAYAISQAPSGATITLLADTSIDYMQGYKAYTLDLGEKTLTAGFVDIDGGKVTIKHGIVTSAEDGDGYFMYVYSSADDTKGVGEYSQLTIGSEGTTINGDIVLWGSYEDSSKGYGAELTITGTNTTINGCVFVSGNITEGNDVVNVRGNIISDEDIGVALNGYATLNIDSSLAEIKAANSVTNFTGVEVRSGILNVTKGRITGKGEYKFTENGNGTTSTGVGIAVAQHTTQNNIQVNISGGVIDGTVALALANPQKNKLGELSVSVTGGTFTSTDNTASPVVVDLDESETRVNGFISGGTFNKRFDASYCVAGYEPVYNSANNTYGVDTIKVAQIGNTKYTSLADAFEAAKSYETIELLTDVTLTNYLEVPAATYATLDLNGHNITGGSGALDLYGRLTVTDNTSAGAGKISATSWGIWANAGAELRIYRGTVEAGNWAVVAQGENCKVDVIGGKVHSENGVAISGIGNSQDRGYTINISGGEVVSDNDIAIYHPNGTSLIISGGTVTGATAIYQKAGTLEISGGTITGKGAKADFAHNGNGANATGDAIVVESCQYPSGTPTTTITGGTISATNGAGIADYTWDDPAQTGEPEPSVITAKSNSITLPEGEMWIPSEVAGEYVIGKAVAEIDGTPYATLAEAVAAAQSGDTIKLLANIDLTATQEITKSMTINLNGHNITANGVRALWVKNGEVTISGTGVISANGDELGATSSVIRVGDSAANTNKAKLTIDAGVTVSSAKCYGVTVFGVNDTDNDKTTSDIELVLNGKVNVTGESAAISGNGTSTNSATTMTIGETAEATATGDYAIYHPGKGTLTVNGTVSGLGGIEAKGGSVTINDGASVTATATAQAHSAYNNGASTSGYAIAAVNNPNYTGDPTVTINGGTISGKTIILADFNAPNNGTVTATSNEIATDPGYKWVETGTAGTYKLVEIEYVAQIGEAKYETLAEAVDAAQDGDTITLLADVNLTATQVITKSMTIDLNGHNITAQNCRALWIKSGDVDITAPMETAGEGKNIVSVIHDANDTTFASSSSVIRVGDSDANSTPADLLIGTFVTVSTDYCYGISVFGKNTESVPNGKPINLWVSGTVAVTGEAAAISGNGSAGLSETKIIIGGGTVSATQDYAIYHPGRGELSVQSLSNVKGLGGIEIKAGTAEINGNVTATADSQTHSAYNNGASTSGYAIAAVSNPNYAGDPTVTIYGGTITGKAIILADFDAQNNGTVTAKSSTIATDSDYKWAETETPGTYKLVEKTYVAQTGETKYETFAEAWNAANAASGSTMKLLADVELNEQYVATGNFTLELNGHNINTSSRLRLVDGTLNITNTSNPAAGGSITTSNAGMAPVDIRFSDAADKTAKRTLTIGENVTLNGPCYGLNIFGTNDGTTANTIDVTVDGTVNGMLFVLGNLSNTGNNINITVNGTVDASNAKGEETVHTGIALNGNAKVTVNDGAIVKGDSGIEVRAGNLTVNGGSIEATAESFSYTANGSGTTTKGAAIAVAQHGTKLPTTATLNGGTLTGNKMIGVTDVNNNMSGVNVTATESFTKSSAIPAGYAWKETTGGDYTLVPAVTVTVTFNANGGSGEMAAQTVQKNAAATLNENEFAKAGFAFSGWATTAEGEKVYEDKASVTLSENTTLYAVWTPATDGAALQASGASLGLEGRVILRMWTLPISGSKADHVTLTLNGRTRQVSCSSPDITSGDYKIYNMPVYAREMGDNVVLKVFDAENNQLKIRLNNGTVVDEYTYTVDTYTEKTAPTAPQKALVDSMSVYGDYAQYYFENPKSGTSMPGGNLNPIDPSILENYKAIKNAPDGWDGPTYAGGSLSLQEGTYVRVFFSGSVSGCTFTCEGKELTPVEYGNYHYVTIDNIAAKDLDTMYTIEVTKGGSVYSVQYSALTYVRTVLTTSQPQTLKDVMTALYWYNFEANKYF